MWLECQPGRKPVIAARQRRSPARHQPGLLHQPACIGCRAAGRILQLSKRLGAPGRARQLLHLFTQKILDHLVEIVPGSHLT